MIEIRALKSFDVERFIEIASGYTSHERYAVRKTETDGHAAFTLELERLDVPYTKQWGWEDDPTLYDRYQKMIVEHGLSFGAYDGDRLVGVTIAEARDWNRSLSVPEVHVDACYHRQGIGRRLMDALVEAAGRAGLASVVAETQNTNVPAIRFYRSTGLEIDGIVLSFYGPDIDEIAFFMTRRIHRWPAASA